MYYKSFFAEVTDSEIEKDVTALLRKNYPDFVNALGEFSKDEKFVKFLQSKPAKTSTIREVFIPVSKLIPTQNQIDITKSLIYPITDTSSTKQCLKGGSVSIAGNKIIVYNGKYIIDGHHRWSQLYAMNKDAKIACYDFINPDVKGPIGALKMTQLAIVATGAEISPESAPGVNLLTASEEKVTQYILSKLKNGPVVAFESFGKIPNGVEGDAAKNAIAKYIWKNVEEMQQTSQPVKNAPKRDFMPQADKATGKELGTIKQLKTGVKTPIPLKEHTMTTKTKLKELIRNLIKEEILNEAAGANLPYKVQNIIKLLTTDPGCFVIDRLKEIAQKSSMTQFPKELYDDLGTIYKAADAKAAKAIEEAANITYYEQTKEKHAKLETIKKRANEIQKSLKPKGNKKKNKSA